MEDQELPPGYTEKQVESLKGYLRSTTLARTARNKLTDGMYQKLREKLFAADPYYYSDMPLTRDEGVDYIQDLLDERTYEGNQRKGLDIGWKKHLEGKVLEALYAAVTTKREKETRWY